METILLRLKKSLPVTSCAYDDVLLQLIRSTVEKFGADITVPEDQTLVILYAAWLWDSRKTPGLAKPPALQMAINDRKVGQTDAG